MSVVGRVARVRARSGGGWRIRLSETGGALAAGDVHPPLTWPLPRVGTRVLLRGRLRYDEVHGWYTVDPVETWIECTAV